MAIASAAVLVWGPGSALSPRMRPALMTCCALMTQVNGTSEPMTQIQDG